MIYRFARSGNASQSKADERIEPRLFQILRKFANNFFGRKFLHSLSTGVESYAPLDFFALYANGRGRILVQIDNCRTNSPILDKVFD